MVVTIDPKQGTWLPDIRTGCQPPLPRHLLQGRPPFFVHTRPPDFRSDGIHHSRPPALPLSPPWAALGPARAETAQQGCCSARCLRGVLGLTWAHLLRSAKWSLTGKCSRIWPSTNQRLLNLWLLWPKGGDKKVLLLPWGTGRNLKAYFPEWYGTTEGTPTPLALCP